MLDGLKRVMFVGAHTDDEIIAAGTLHRLARSGTEVTVVSLARAGTESDRLADKHFGGKDEMDVHAEWVDSVKAIKALGHYPGPYQFNPSYRILHEQQPVRQYIHDAVVKWKPDAAFILSPTDGHPEHAAVALACEAVMRGRVDVILRCHYPWNFGVGMGNVYVSLSEEDIKAKAASIAAYKSQMFRYNYGEMLMAQARVDGLSVKVDYAERFELMRGLIRDVV